MSNLSTVQAIYQAFGQGDIPAILDLMADDVAWEAWDDNSAQAAGVSHLVPRRGKAGVAEFFGIVGTFEVTDFQVLSIMEGGNQVVAEIVIEVHLPNGGSFRDEELHLWTFDGDGKVSRLRHYTDTAKHIAAAAGTATVRSAATS
jgi:ketosteroid isomerase-like protein